MAPNNTESSRPSPYREHWRSVVAVAVLAVLTGLFETATIVTIVAFIEGVTTGDLRWEVAQGPIDVALGRTDLAIIAAISLTGMTVGQLAAAWLRARAVTGWQYRMQMRAVRAYMGASWSAQSSETSGSLQNLMSLSWNSAQGLGALMSLLSAAGAVAIFTIAAFFAAPVAAAALLVTGAALMLVLRPIRAAAREATRTATVAQRAVAERLGEIHDLAQEVRVHQAEGAVAGQMNVSSRALRVARQRAMVVSAIGGVLYRSIGLAFVFIAALVASGQTELDVARVGVAGLLLLRSLSYGQGLQTSWQALENNRPYIEQVGDALEAYDLSAPRRGTTKVDHLGDLELREVSYAYGPDGPALRQVDLTIDRGETIGVVGPSGGGKSTLAQILLGLREPTSGSYVVDGVPAIDVAADRWFQLVTVVPQQPKLMTASVLENIVFHRPWVDRVGAERAATAAGLHDEIEALPDGYDTVIGDAVRDLSGGQRQRLGIARALAGNPELLVLDEPTSALDAMSEQRVQQTLERLKGEVTVVIIAHRLSTLNRCDRLLVLESGAVRALDRPGIVMEQNEFYRDAVRMQLISAGEPGN